MVGYIIIIGVSLRDKRLLCRVAPIRQLHKKAAADAVAAPSLSLTCPYGRGMDILVMNVKYCQSYIYQQLCNEQFTGFHILTLMRKNKDGE